MDAWTNFEEKSPPHGKRLEVETEAGSVLEATYVPGPRKAMIPMADGRAVNAYDYFVDRRLRPVQDYVGRWRALSGGRR